VALKQNKLDKLNLTLFFNDLPEKKRILAGSGCWTFTCLLKWDAQLHHPFTPTTLYSVDFFLLAPQITLVRTERENVSARKEAHNRWLKKGWRIREFIPHIDIIPKVISLKLFLDIVLSSSAENVAMRESSAEPSDSQKYVCVRGLPRALCGCFVVFAWQTRRRRIAYFLRGARDDLIQGIIGYHACK